MKSRLVVMLITLGGIGFALILCISWWLLHKRDVPRRTLRILGWGGCLLAFLTFLSAVTWLAWPYVVSPGGVVKVSSKYSFHSDLPPEFFPYPISLKMKGGRGVAHMEAFPPPLPVVLSATTTLSPALLAPSPTPKLLCPPVEGTFASAWLAFQGELGCATGDPFQGLIAEENFEGGKMFWREPVDYAQALVLFSDGHWEIFQHSPYPEGSPEFSCVDERTPAQCPPTPKRGFGMMWCDIPAIRSGLGNATDCERGYIGWMQSFERGFMIRTDGGVIFIFQTESHRWEQW